MGKAVIVSFEESVIRIVYTSGKGDNPTVKDALLLKDEQFDNFLLQEKTKEFLVVNSFKDFFQEIILIPPAKERYVKALATSEIRKKSQFSNFSFIHTLLGEKVVDGKKMKELFVFAVKNDEINGIVDRFVRRNKVVKAFYPDIFAVASMIDSMEKPMLCVIEAGLNKTLFLVSKGNVYFVRTVQSLEAGFGNLDVQDINMTVNYCWQSLKMGPSIVMLTPGLCKNYNATMDVVVPVACIIQRYTSRKSEIARDYTAPLSAILVSTHGKINLLTSEFKRFFQVRQFLIYTSFLFLIAFIAGIGYVVFSAGNIAGMNRKLTSVRSTLPDIEGVIAEYDKKNEELIRYAPYIDTLNNAALTPDIREFLSLLTKLNMENLKLNSISVTPGEHILHGELKGSVNGGSYADTQRHYQLLLGHIAKLKGFVVAQSSLDLKNMEFFIQVDFNDL